MVQIRISLIIHYHHDTFAWICDRDEDMKSARFPDPNVEKYKIKFETNDKGIIDSVVWVYDSSEPHGEIFKKE